MIAYLTEFNITTNEIEELNKILSTEIINNLDIMQSNVKQILNLLQSLKVTNLYNVIKYRPDLLFEDKQILEKKLTGEDKELLNFIMNNSVDDLNNYNI